MVRARSRFLDKNPHFVYIVQDEDFLGVKKQEANISTITQKKPTSFGIKEKINSTTNPTINLINENNVLDLQKIVNID